MNFSDITLLTGVKKVFFIGFLANVDESILKLKLDYGFKIESMLLTEGCKLIQELDNINNKWSVDSLRDLVLKFRCGDHIGKRLYYITNSFTCSHDINHGGFEEILDWDQKNIHPYLKKILRIIRLFKSGNICMPLDYHYQLGENNRKITILKSVHNSPVVNELYHLEAEDISLFMCGTDLHFKNQILEVALENFELSYSITHKELRFLCLMISLEVLFNPHSQTELTYQISRSAAIIIGNNKGERTIIFNEIKRLYGLRSGLFHTGKSTKLCDADSVKLGLWIRQSIKKLHIIMNQTGKERDAILDELSCVGFDDTISDKILKS